jgi:RND family efflux transporter MFP subunit
MLSGCDSTTPVVDTPPPPVSVCQPLVQEVIDYDDYEGRIGAVDVVEVRARVRGHLVKVNFQDGQIVKKKDLLFEIDPRPYKAALDAAEAQKAVADANLELAKKEYARTSGLTRTGAASREELDVWIAKQATASAERLKALASVEEAQLDMDFTKVTAEIGGKISRPLVTVGNLVNAGGGETLLTTIESVDPMYVYFDVDERALRRYRDYFGKHLGEGGYERPVKDLKIPVMVGLEGEEGYPQKGLIDFVENKVNAGTGTIQARGILPDPKRLMDTGMRARVRVPVGDPHKSLLITERAVGTDQGLKFVYVVQDEKVQRRYVKLGRVRDGLQVVLEGLKPEDRVIVNGIQRVRDGIKVESNPVSMPGTPAEPANDNAKS